MTRRSIHRQVAIVVLVGLASSEAAFGAVSISGDVSLNLGAIGAPVQIGNQTMGSLRVDDGSVIFTGSATMGQNTPGFGTATVTGSGSQWNVTGAMDVGGSGIGRLNILDGAVVNLSQGGTFRVATSQTGHGTVVVDGFGSVLQVAQLFLGTNGGRATLQIGDGAVVNASASTAQIGTQGRVELDGGLLRAAQLTQGGVIIGAGEVAIQSTFASSSGRIEAGPGQMLRFTGVSGNLENQGTIAANGGTIEFQRALTNTSRGPTPEITLRNGLIRIAIPTEGALPQLTNRGLLAATGGVNDFYGRVSNLSEGNIAIANDSVLIFHDSVTAQSGVITVFPGSKAIFLEDLELGETAVLHANVAGTDDDTGFGVIEVIDDLALGSGTLEVALEGAYTPKLGDTFPLIAAGGSISGSLSLAASPSLPNVLAWDLDIDASHVVLSVVPALAGDYNASGVVDAADYAVWRRILNQAGAALPADGDDNNIVDAADYDVWRANYGRTIGEAAAPLTAVPEPATAILLFASAFVPLRFKRRR